MKRCSHIFLYDRPVQVVRDLGFIESLGMHAKVVLYRGSERTVVGGRIHRYNRKGLPWKLIEGKLNP